MPFMAFLQCDNIHLMVRLINLFDTTFYVITFDEAMHVLYIIPYNMNDT